MPDIVGQLREVGAHDWRTAHLAHTSDTANAGADEIVKLRAALKGLSDIYTSAFDLVDGGLILLPDSVPRYEAANKMAMEALGIHLVEIEAEE
jgi:hypothetical protein